MAVLVRKESRNRCTEGTRHNPVRRSRESLFSAFLGKAQETMEPQMQLQGRRELYVEECQGVLSCDDNLVKLQLRGMTLTILGAGLTVSDFTVSTLTVHGDIRGLELEPVSRKEKSR